MALSQIIKKDCPQCGKIAVEKSRFTLGTTTLITLACGHLISSLSHQSSDESIYDSVVFSDGKKPRHYQIDCVKFAERAEFNCIIADGMGLGKTVEAATIVRLHRETLTPCVVVCPTSVKINWFREFIRVVNPEKGNKDPNFLIQMISNGKEQAIPGMAVYIVTYDLLKKEQMFDYVDDIKLIIFDECQKIKNHLSDRAKAAQKMRRKAKYCIPMSGTPIKNNAGEYFTTLNLVDSFKFNNYQSYLDTYCDTYESGWGTKVGGLKDPERFHADTENLIIRRTKEEVLSDLPPKDRQFYHVPFDDKFGKAYNNLIDELEDLLYDKSFAGGAAKIAIMSKMRHITGLSKVEDCIEYVIDFLCENDRKIVIFHHHQDVAALLEKRINDFITTDEYSASKKLDKCLMMQSNLNGQERSNLVDRFRESGTARVMIASTLAAGEGINLQFCSDAVMLERQWNPANEEQAEDRFHRFGQINPVTIKYFIASETIDEYFTELVEAKRAIVSSTLDNKEIQWDERSLASELAEILVAKGKKKWSL